MRINIDDCLFCLVDVQERLFPLVSNHEAVENNLLILIKGLQALKVPFIINEQYKKGLGDTITSIKELVKDEPHFEKLSFSICKNEATLEALKKSNKKEKNKVRIIVIKMFLLQWEVLIILTLILIFLVSFIIP